MNAEETSVDTVRTLLVAMVEKGRAEYLSTGNEAALLAPSRALAEFEADVAAAEMA